MASAQLFQKGSAVHDLGHRGHVGQRSLVRGFAEGRAAVRQDNDVVVTHMGIAHRAGHTAVGHDAADHQRVDARFLEHPVELRVEKGRVRHLEHRHIDQRREQVHIGLAPAAGREIALAQKRAALFEVRRNHRLALRIGPQGEQAGRDQTATPLDGAGLAKSGIECSEIYRQSR